MAHEEGCDMTTKQTHRPRSDYTSFQEDTVAIRSKHRRDTKLIERIVADAALPAVTQGRKAYVIHWAGGRALCAVRSKAALKAWFQRTGTCAELVSVEHKDAGSLTIRSLKGIKS
jgi:hypothetical protein